MSSVTSAPAVTAGAATQSKHEERNRRLSFIGKNTFAFAAVHLLSQRLSGAFPTALQGFLYSRINIWAAERFPLLNPPWHTLFSLIGSGLAIWAFEVAFNTATDGFDASYANAAAYDIAYTTSLISLLQSASIVANYSIAPKFFAPFFPSWKISDTQNLPSRTNILRKEYPSILELYTAKQELAVAESTWRGRKCNHPEIIEKLVQAQQAIERVIVEMEKKS